MVPGTTPLCQEHVIKKERKKKKKSEELATHPHLSETCIHAHTSRQKPADVQQVSFWLPAKLLGSSLGP